MEIVNRKTPHSNEALGTENTRELTEILLHELKQPLLCVLVLAERLQSQVGKIDDIPSPEKNMLDRDLSSLLSNVFQIRELLNAGGAFVKKSYVEDGWGERILNTLESLQEVANQSKIQLTFEEKTNQQDSGPAPRLVSQVLSNLITNAIQAMENKELSEKKINVTTEISGENITFLVEDSGGGIPPENRDNIFKKSFTTKEAMGGSGIGLWLCQEIAKAFGGELTLEQPKKLGGACFRFTLPLNGEKCENEMSVVA